MPETIEVLFTPCDFEALKKSDLSSSTCVVFDVLRATTSMLTALANGAAGIIPVSEISEALAVKKQRPEVLLAGERHGMRIRAAQTGGVDFDLGNSPREYIAQKVAGRLIVSTTTNGTRALRSCLGARQIFVGALVNINAVARAVVASAPKHLILVCSGTFEETAYEDALAAGALLERLGGFLADGIESDAALMARMIYQRHAEDLMGGLSIAKNGRKLLSIPELRDDVAVCAQRDSLDFAGYLCAEGIVKAVS